MAGGVVPLRDKSTGFSECFTGTPKRAQDKLLAGAARDVTPGGCFLRGNVQRCAWDGCFLESL